MLRKLIQVLFLLTFWSGLAFIGVQTWNFPTLETTENRTLTKKPQLPDSWSNIPEYIRNIESWWSDSIAFRQLFIRRFNLMRMSAGIQPQKDVVLGKDGWLFSGGDSLDEFRNNKLFTASEVEAWRQYLLFRHIDAKKRGAKFVFVIVPNKESVYAEYMPDHITKLGKKSRTDQIVESVKDDGVVVLDSMAVLKEGKAHSRVYHQNDTHWNLIGANYGQYAVSSELAKDFPKLKPVLYPLSDFEFVAGFYVNQAGIVYYGGLSYMMGIGDLTDEYEPIFKEAKPKCAEPAELDVTPWLSVPEAQRTRTFHASRCATGNYRVVAFRDSFTELLEPYWSEMFQYIAYLWLPRPTDMQAWNYFLDAVQPDIVIDETVEKYLGVIPRSGIDYPGLIQPEDGVNGDSDDSGPAWHSLSEKQKSVLSIVSSVWPTIPAEKRQEFMAIASEWELLEAARQKEIIRELQTYQVAH